MQIHVTSVCNTSARTSLPPDNVVWFIIYQIISDIIVLIKRYPTVETKHSTSFQFRYSPIKRAVNCGLLSLRQGASWHGNCLHERDGAGAVSQRILLELPRLIGTPCSPALFNVHGPYLRSVYYSIRTI